MLIVVISVTMDFGDLSDSLSPLKELSNSGDLSGSRSVHDDERHKRNLCFDLRKKNWTTF